MIEIYRSSRIEQLAELLAEHLRQQAPRSVLTPQTLQKRCSATPVLNR